MGGQFSSSGEVVPTAATVAAAAAMAMRVEESGGGEARQNSVHACREPQQRTASLVRPSQPIDICGASASAARFQQRRHWLPQQPQPQRVAHHRVALQRSASEMATKCGGANASTMPSVSQHQPRVIQPRRLASTSGAPCANYSSGGVAAPSAACSSVGPARQAENNVADHRRRSEQHTHQSHHQHPHHPLLLRRSRGFTVDAAPTVHHQQQQPTTIDADCPSTSGEMNKENFQQLQLQQQGAEQQRDSMNSNGGNILPEKLPTASEIITLDAQKNSVGDEVTVQQQRSTVSADTVAQQHQQEQHQQSLPRRVPSGGGRIAYLYGVYGAPDMPPKMAAYGTGATHVMPTMLTSTPTQQQQRYGSDAYGVGAGAACRNAFADYANVMNGGGGADGFCWDEEDCCCFDEDAEEEADDREADALGGRTHCVVHSLHSVSDIIGYAKVVRAQRNETLGRLNDVMSQFDALIRSYSMAMRSAKQQQQLAEQNGTTVVPEHTVVDEDAEEGGAGGIPPLPHQRMMAQQQTHPMEESAQ